MGLNRPDIANVVASGIYNGEPFVNVFHFRKADGSDMTVGNLATLHGILDDAAADVDALAHMYQRFDSNLLVNKLYSKTYSEFAPVELSTAVSIAGTSVGSDAQPMLACMVKWSTLVADRRFRGRTYFSGINTGHWDTTDVDQLASSFVTDFQTKVNAFVTAWSTHATFEFGVFSRTSELEAPTSGWSEIQAGAVQSRIGIQKRRSPGR